MILSYIIPVFNSAKFITTCLESLIIQQLLQTDYEIIMVNDGSSDDSEMIINKWCKNHPDIIVKYFKQENRGQGSARNLGISKSSGKYIWFVDSDDFLQKNSAKILLEELIKDDLDAIWFDHRLVDIACNTITQPKIDCKKDFSTEIYNGELFLKKVFKTSCMPVMFLFKKELITNNKLFFHEGIYFEDIIFTPKLIYYSKKIKYYNLVVYNYVIHSNSTMRSTDKLYKRTLDSLVVIQEMLKFSRLVQNPTISEYVDIFTAKILMYNYRLAISQKNPSFLKIFKAEMIKKQLYPFKIRQPFKIAAISKIANLSPYIFERLSHIRPIK